MNTDALKPGIHFMQGNRVLKSVALNGDYDIIFGGDGRTQSPSELAASVGWVFIAVNKRRKSILEIPFNWERNGSEIDERDLPFIIQNDDTESLIYRIDPALQLMRAACLLKLRNGRRFVGLRWINPGANYPERSSLTAQGYQTYTYQTTSGPQPIPAEDIIRIIDPMLSEHDPGIVAGQASSLAAQILLGMSETADTFYDTNGLPVVAVIVPPETSDPDTETIRDRFERIFQRRRSTKGNKTIGVRGDVKIQTISFAPKDLAMNELDIAKRQEILLAHEVPPAIVYSDVNTNQASDKMQQFIGALGTRLKMVCKAISRDPDIAALGVELVSHVQEHWSMKGDEALRALAVTRYATVMKPKAAGYIMGITDEDFPPEMQGEIWLESTQGSVVSGTGAAEQPVDTVQDSMKAAELVKLRRFVANGRHLKRPFESDILTPYEIAREVAISQDAPFHEGYLP